MTRYPRPILANLTLGTALAGLLAWGGLAAPAEGQTLQQRIDHVERQRSREAQVAAQTEAIQRQQAEQLIVRRLHQVIDEVSLQDQPVREAFAGWAETTGVPLVIDWEAMALAGVDPDRRITLELRQVPAYRLLSVLMQQAGQETTLIREVTPWYVRVMTKAQANREPVLRVYDVGDLLMEVPHFASAPSFDLNEALGDQDSQGTSLFGDGQNETAQDRPRTRADRGEELAELVRATIEPDIWQAHGGVHGSIRYHQGKLIVRAPAYVQEQIGGPNGGGYLSPSRGRLTAPPARRARATTGATAATAKPNASRSSLGGVGGVGGPAKPTAGIAD